MSKNMKFDVVMGNPPYNSLVGEAREQSKNTNNSNLSFEFIKRAIKLSARGICLIVPASCLTNNKMKTVLVDSGLKNIDFLSPSLFPTVKIRAGVCAIFLEKGYTETIDLKRNNDVSVVSRYSSLEFVTQINQQILEKIDFSNNFSSRIKIGDIDAPKGVKGRMRILFTHSDFKETRTKTHKHKVLMYCGGKSNPEKNAYTNKALVSAAGWKVVIPRAYDRFELGTPRLCEPGTGISSSNYYIKVSSKKEALELIDYLTGKLVTYIIGIKKTNDSVNTLKNSISWIPISSQAEVYKLFDKKEIKHIELFSVKHHKTLSI